MRRWCVLLLLVLLCSCGAAEESARYQDGVYRGFYYSDGLEQVAVQFELRDGKFVSVVLRRLNNRWGSLLAEDASEKQKERLQHFTVLCNHLIGKDVDAINELYHPDELLVAAGYTPSENVPYEKLISALWDGVNRRPFKLVDTSKLPEADPYPDGMYTGVYNDDDGEQVVISFILSDNVFTDMYYQKLAYKGIDYLDENAGLSDVKVAGQFQALIDYLVGKPVSAVNDLYLPGEIAMDTDVSSAATLRAPKVISAIWEGLNKNAYTIN